MPRGLVVLLFAACSAPPEPCDWNGYNDRVWTAVEIENGCNLPTRNVDELGCEKQITEVRAGEECSKTFAFQCANELRLTVFRQQDPDFQRYQFAGRDCMTTVTLVPTE